MTFTRTPEAELLDFVECPIYACTLRGEEHSRVDAHFADPDEHSYWHFDGVDGHWPAPFEEEPYVSPGPLPLYSGAAVQEQLKVRERNLAWTRSSWFVSVEDTQWIAEMMGSPTAFSGDLRPVAIDSPTDGTTDRDGQSDDS